MNDTAVMTLTEFLTARIRDDALAAQRAVLAGTSTDPHAIGRAKALRRIVEIHEQRTEIGSPFRRRSGETLHFCMCCDIGEDVADSGPDEGCPTVRAIAAVYADHPDYRQEWA